MRSRSIHLPSLEWSELWGQPTRIIPIHIYFSQFHHFFSNFVIGELRFEKKKREPHAGPCSQKSLLEIPVYIYFQFHHLISMHAGPCSQKSSGNNLYSDNLS